MSPVIHSPHCEPVAGIGSGRESFPNFLHRLIEGSSAVQASVFAIGLVPIEKPKCEGAVCRVLIFLFLLLDIGQIFLKKQNLLPVSPLDALLRRSAWSLQ